MNPIAVAFTGPSNSGKTTLIVKIANLLKENYKLAIIKHDPKDKAIFDTTGKDSNKFTATGAQVAVTSPKRTTFFLNQEKSIEDIIKFLSPFDILMVEGLKTLPLPRIGIFRNKLDEHYFDVCMAVAIDDSIDDKSREKIPSNLDILDLNNEKMIVNWILKNAKMLEVNINE